MRTTEQLPAVNNIAEVQQNNVENKEIKLSIATAKEIYWDSVDNILENKDISWEVLYNSQKILQEWRTAMRLWWILNAISRNSESINNTTFAAPNKTTKLWWPFENAA